MHGLETASVDFEFLDNRVVSMTGHAAVETSLLKSVRRFKRSVAIELLERLEQFERNVELGGIEFLKSRFSASKMPV